LKVDARVIAFLQSLVDSPSMGAKVTAARIGIGRVTLWRTIHIGKASSITLRRIAAFTETTETPKQEKIKEVLCILNM